jgi:hypothetical protein
MTCFGQRPTTWPQVKYWTGFVRIDMLTGTGYSP